MSSRLRTPFVIGLLAAAGVLAGASPGGASPRGHNGRIALAWFDRDAGAHEEAAWQIVTVPWRTGSSHARAVVSCTMVEGCPAQYSSPDYSPNGGQIVYTATSLNGPGPSQLILSNADGSRPSVLNTGPHDSYDPSFLPSGAGLIFVRSNRTASDVSSDPEGQIATLDLTNGTVSPVGQLRGSEPRVSPDGKHILFTHRGGIWTADAQGAHARRLIAHGSHGAFSPNGRSVLYVSGAPLSGIHRLYVAGSDGGHPHIVMGQVGHHRLGPVAHVDQAVFSPDGTQIAFATTDPAAGDPEIFRLPVGGGRERMLWFAAGLDAGGINLGIAWQST